MQVCINEREVGPLVPAASTTIGEIIEALGVHIDQHDILIAVAIDGIRHNAGDPDSYDRRSAASVRRLELTTQKTLVFTATKRREVAEILGVLADQLRQVAALFQHGDEREANGLLAALMEEFRLALLLDRQLVMLDGARPVIPSGEVEALGTALLDAESHRRWRELADLLATRLVPLLEAAGSTPPTTASPDARENGSEKASAGGATALGPARR